ncbi:acyl carrier protein [Schleiferiaceae bacterium]|jgi:hypothetical protein|nr:acyl carrier protein [Schleiferiaceae bacterium]
MSYRRSLNINEQLYFVNSVFKHRDAIQVLVKFVSSGHHSGVEALKKGIVLVSNAHKIHSRRISGSTLYLSKNSEIHIKVHNQDTEPALRDPLFNQPVKDSGTLIEHHIIVTKTNLFLLVKSHHVLMDGAAYVQYLKDIFKAIRGIPLTGDERLYSEEDALPTILTKSKGIQGPRISKVKGKWRSKRPPKILTHDKAIGNICAVLALSASKAMGRKGSFFIPFDLRKFGVCSSGFGNMTLPIYLNVKPTDSLGDITAQLNFQIQSKAPLNNSLSSFGIKTLPSWLLRPSAKVVHLVFRLTGYYFASGFISDLGQLSLQHFSGPNLDAIDLIPIPMVGAQSPYTAFCLSHENGLRIGLAVHAGNGLPKWEKEIQRFFESTDSHPVGVDFAKNTQLGNVVLSAWSRYLNMETQDCKAQSDVAFSNLGGDSVTLVLMCSEIQKELSVEGNQQVMSEIFARGTSITIREMTKIYNQ